MPAEDPQTLGQELDRFAARLGGALAERRARNPKHEEPILPAGCSERIGAVWADDSGALVDVAVDGRAAAELYEQNVITAVIAAINTATDMAKREHRSWLDQKGKLA